MMKRSCVVCNTIGMDQTNYVDHVFNTNHKRNFHKNIYQHFLTDNTDRSIHVSGYSGCKDVSEKYLVASFWQFGVVNIEYNSGFCFIELESVESAQNAMKDSIFMDNVRLSVNRKKRKYKNNVNEYPLLSIATQAMLQGTNVDMCITYLIQEISLSPQEIFNRHWIRQTVENVLRPRFPLVASYIFGSSGNSLGYHDSDLDLYANLGIDPWASGIKTKMEKEAAKLTYILAGTLRRSGTAVEVQAIAKARVPIVKFCDRRTGISVDLSFRHGMSVCNTELICMYASSHPLVRPFLSVIRYWAKVQGVTGSGLPQVLLTNYALVMMCLFVLMNRPQPIIPTIANLRLDPHLPKCIIAGWDCSFSRDLSWWHNQRVFCTTMELICEFFEYWSDFSTFEWVVSPVIGHLVSREEMKSCNQEVLPSPFLEYCKHGTPIEADTVLCVQDPFDHSFNVTRGLKSDAFALFKFKCLMAKNTCHKIMCNQAVLLNLFSTISISPKIFADICSVTFEEETVKADDIISAGANGDIEPVKEASGSGVTHDVGEISTKDIDDIQVIATVTKDKVIHVIDLVKIDEDVEQHDNVMLSADFIEKSSDKFLMVFPDDIPDFDISENGDILPNHSELLSVAKIPQLAERILLFFVKECLKGFITDQCELNVASSGIINGKKRRLEEAREGDIKRRRAGDSSAVSMESEHRLISEFTCEVTHCLWVNRKKVSKHVPLANMNPLVHEREVTRTMLEMVNGIQTYQLLKPFPFRVVVKQNVNSQRKLQVTLTPLCNSKFVHIHFGQLSSCLSSRCSMFPSRLANYVKVSVGKNV